MKFSPHGCASSLTSRLNDHQSCGRPYVAGIAVEGISGEGDDTVFEMEITDQPSRRHESLRRGARSRPRSMTCRSSRSNPSCRSRKATRNFAIDIDDKEGCARYTGAHHARRDRSSLARTDRQAPGLVDQRSINNAADATNYTLWEMGHPTHAFDLDLLEGGKIIVRRARDGETLKTLDGIERKLSSEDLVIADGRSPVALAGVMGGFDTMITEKTKNVLIESAWFDPVHGSQDVAAARLAHRCLASLRARRGFRRNFVGLRARGAANSGLRRRRVAGRSNRRDRAQAGASTGAAASARKCSAFWAKR